MMAPGQYYTGPTALAHSKYASPAQKNAVMGLEPSVAVPHNNAAVSSGADNTVATKEQIVAVNSNQSFDTVPHNANIELAIAHGNSLKVQVDQYAEKVSRTLSSTMANTRQLLELIRDSMQKGNASDLKTVEHLWMELEQLFAAANEAKTALPDFLEKQRNNMSLYHASMMNETFRETQEELNVQHKKVNIQHSLILEHQEAFHEYKAQTAAKLKQLEELQERVSRLTLEKGNFRTEIEKYKQLLEELKSSNTDHLQKVDALQKELEILMASKRQLATENETLRDKLIDFKETMKTAERRITDRFTAELQAKTEVLAKEVQKSTSLSALINVTKGGENTARSELDKIKLEHKALNEKYKNLAAEYSRAFTTLNEQMKEIDTLTNDLGRLQGEHAELKQRLVQLPELEKQNSELIQAKSTLLEQVDRLTTELDAAKDNGNQANAAVDALREKIKSLEREIENLETENNNLLSKQSENKKSVQALSILKAENSKLKTTVDDLRAERLTPAVASSPDSEKEKKILEEKINLLELNKASLEVGLQEWSDLAKHSYEEYKKMLPMYKQAEQFRQDTLDKDEVIQGLKLEISSAKSSHSNGVGAGGGDAAYWKEKYETLLSRIGD